MDSGLYAAYTGLLSRTQALDTAANNLANADATGFRAQRDYFRGVLAGIDSQTNRSQIGDAVNAYGILGGTRADLSQGQITSTGNPLDLAINGDGFFAVKTPQGTRYTRDGSFLRAEDGTLTTHKGQPVLNSSGAPIMLPAGDVHIAPDGTVSVSGADGSAIVGNLALYTADAADLSAEGANLMRLRDGANLNASTAAIQQGSLEGANQDAVHGTMQLLMIQRQAEMMQRALSVFHNDFDKTAAEELGKV